MERFVFAAALLLVALVGFAAATGHGAVLGLSVPPETLAVFAH